MKKKIAFVLPSLEGGGAERVTINIMNNLDAEKFEVFLIVGRKEGKLKEVLTSSIRVYDMKVNRMSHGLKQLLTILKEEEPDLVFSVMGYVNLLCMIANLIMGSRFKLILSEHSTVSMEYKRNISMMMKIQRKLKRILYPRAEAIVCVSEGVKKDLEEFLEIRLENARVLHNPILDNDYWNEIKPEKHEWFSKDNFTVITAGRLVPEKGHSDLIVAMDELVNNRKEKDVKLLVLGEGPEKARLEKLIKKFKLQNNVQLLGFQKNIKGFFIQSNVFVLSSLFEGLPTALIEAMGLKLPVISTRCPSGPEEIITSEEQGILVSIASPNSLADAILKVKCNREYRETLKEQGYIRSMDFRTSIIIAKYEDLFAELICRD